MSLTIEQKRVLSNVIEGNKALGLSEKEACESAGVNYNTYRGWKNKKLANPIVKTKVEEKDFPIEPENDEYEPNPDYVGAIVIAIVTIVIFAGLYIAFNG